MAGVSLNATEQELRNSVNADLERLHQFYRIGGGLTSDEFNEIEQRMGKNARKLHMSLHFRGIEPRHHAYMIKNRELQPDDPKFYVHVHPVEDLLKFIEDDRANDDPVDQTIGHDFKFRVYSKRWGHDDTYTIQRTEDGWLLKEGIEKGPCDKTGHPFLFRLLDHDSIDYPHGLRDRMEWLWIKASVDGLSHEDLEVALQQLADWVSLTVREKPSGGAWSGGF